MQTPQTLLKKLRAMPPERIAEVENFVEFIAAREQERSLARAVNVPASASIWNNPEDDAYGAQSLPAYPANDERFYQGRFRRRRRHSAANSLVFRSRLPRWLL